jgi:hypothetical protein
MAFIHAFNIPINCFFHLICVERRFRSEQSIKGAISITYQASAADGMLEWHRR